MTTLKYDAMKVDDLRTAHQAQTTVVEERQRDVDAANAALTEAESELGVIQGAIWRWMGRREPAAPELPAATE